MTKLPMDKPVDENEATPIEIMSLCRYFRIRAWMDSLYMTEVGIAGGRVDLMVVDLRTFDIYGYEVKSSRSDFTSDKKWKSYVPFFNYFYFATPPGIIDKKELPPEVGLLECRSTKGENSRSRQLVQVKRAQLLQPMFVKSLGERHLIRTLLGYMRDWNWRHERLLHVDCPKCGIQVPCRDPRGLPFGNYSPKGELERVRQEELLRANNDRIEI